MRMKPPLLIVFTDELGSTPYDVDNQESRDIVSARCGLFGNQIRKLNTKGWKILKNVGDQLVLRFDRKSAATEVCRQNIIDCLKDFFLAWKESNGRLRVAVHSPSETGLAYGKDVKMYLLPVLKNAARYVRRSVKNIRPLKTIWPSYRYLKDDIFGREMTLVARLVALPKESLFVITENVVNKCGYDALNQNVTSWGGTVSQKIPLINIKGFESMYNFKNPLYICEIIKET